MERWREGGIREGKGGRKGRMDKGREGREKGREGIKEGKGGRKGGRG